MKEYYIVCVLILLFNFLFVACQEDSTLPLNKVVQYTPQQITDAPYKDQIFYAKHHLGILSQSLLGVVNDKKFHDILYAEIRKESTGESSTLFSDIFKVVSAKEPSLIDKMEHRASSGAFINSQKAFWGIEEMIFFPQIYIPFFNEREQKISEKGKRVNEYPTVVTDPISNIEVVTGYTVDEYGEIVEVERVDEEYAQYNEVWVVSLNERAEVSVVGFANDCDTYAFLCYPDYKGKHTVDQPSLRTNNTNNLRNTCTSDGNPGVPKDSERGIDIFINNMTIKEHKEPWHAGASEVNISMTTIWGRGVNEFTGQSDKTAYWDEVSSRLFRKGYTREYIDEEIEKVNRPDINFERSKEIDMRIATKWGGPGDKRRDSMPFVVYEHDAWPSKATITTTTYTAGRYIVVKPEFNINQYTFTVRTRESTPYCNSFFNWYQGNRFYACGSNRNNNEINIDFYTRKPF